MESAPAEQNDKVPINAENFQQPPLLRTCRQIRNEAASIYYHEDKFQLLIAEFKSDAVASWWQHAHSPSEKLRDNAFITWPHTRGTREDLLIWLRRIHGLKAPYQRQSQNNRADKKLISKLFKTVRMLGDLPWARVEEVVQNEINVMLLTRSLQFRA